MSVVTPASTQELMTTPPRTGGLWRDGARRFLANPLAVAGLVVVTVVVLAAILAPVIALTDYDEANILETLEFPSAAHPLGTDAVGRDFYSRIVYGARTSMLVGFAASLLSLVIGVPLGALAGWRGGWVDTVVLRIVELMTAVPGLLVALLLVSLYGGGLANVILFLGLFGWVGTCRLARAQFLALREREFVTAARATGTPEGQIMTRHVLTNAAGPILLAFTMAIPGAIFGEAGLSFLGMGINDPIPSWGKMISESSAYILVYWHLALFPTAILAITILAFNFVGDGLRDAIDPYSDR
jgi:ABC-type dipeptide/oligopeptide/nickel transport system permease subunit